MNLRRELLRCIYGHQAASPHGKGGGSAPPPPDPAIGQAEKEMADTQAQALQQYSSVWEPQQLAQMQQANQISQAAEKQYETTAQQQNAISQNYYDEYKNTYEPLMNQMVDEAKNYSTEGNYQQQAQMAIGNVDQTMDAQQKAQAMQMQSVGVDPTSGAFQGMWNANGINAAAQKAAAGTQARFAAQQLGWQMQDQAAAMGQGLPGAQAQAASVGTAATGGSVAAANSGVANTNQSASTGSSAFGTAGQIQQGMGQLGNGAYQTQVNAWNAQQQQEAQSAAGIGSLVGTAAGAAAMFM
jgi:hypothetical protein